MSTPRATLYQLYTDLECNSGTYIDDFPRMGKRSKSLNGDGSLSLSVPLSHRIAPLVDTGYVVYVRLSDGTAEEWRISDYTISSGVGGDELKIIALRDTYELSENQGLITKLTGAVRTTTFTSANVTPTYALTNDVLPALSGSWSLGTVDPTASVTVSYADDTAKSGIDKIIAALKAQGISAELRVRKRSGSAGYYIDLLTQIGSTSPVVEISLGKNATNLQAGKSRTYYATRAYPKTTDGASIEGALWRVTSVVATTIGLAKLDGSGGPVGFADQFNTNYYLEKRDGTLTQITDCTSSPNAVVVASAATISVNDLVRIRKGSSGESVLYVESFPVGAAPKIKKLTGPIAARNNVLINPVFYSWGAGVPTDWTETDASGYNTWSSDSTKVIASGQSAKARFVATSVVGSAQLKSLPVNVVNTATTRTWRCLMWVYCDNANTTYTAARQPNFTIQLIVNSVVVATSGPIDITTTGYANTWVPVVISGSGGGTGVCVNIIMSTHSSGGTYDWIMYFGGGTIEESASNPSDVAVGSGAAEAWSYGNTYLANPNQQSFKYEATLLDLARFSSSLWNYEDLDVGVTARIKASHANVDTSVRVTSMTIDDEDTMHTEFVFSTVPLEFSTIYATE